MEKLSRKQQQALDVIVAKTKAQGYPPTLQELTEALGAASRNTAIKYLRILERKGYIIWQHKKARGIQLLEPASEGEEAEEIGLPLIGTVAAGSPMLAEENIERHVAVPKFLLRSPGQYFLLRVRGNSMVGAGILPDDLVIVRSQPDAQVGEVVVALLDGEATVKRLAMKHGRRFLKAENPAMEDIHPEAEWSIQGKVVALIREEVA